MENIKVGPFEIRSDTHPSTTHMKVRDIERVVETIEACTFPWEHIVVPNLKQRNRYPFPIEFEPNARDGALGYVSSNRLWLAPRRTGVAYTTIAHELGHVADLGSLAVNTGGGMSWHSFGSGVWRNNLMDIANHHDLDRRNHPHAWRVGDWAERVIEAITVPWTRAFFDDPKFHYPEWRFTGRGHTWSDVSKVKDIFLDRNSAQAAPPTPPPPTPEPDPKPDPTPPVPPTLLEDNVKLVQLDRRGGAAYFADPTTKTLHPLSARWQADAITGKDDWHTEVVVVPRADVGRAGWTIGT